MSTLNSSVFSAVTTEGERLSSMTGILEGTVSGSGTGPLDYGATSPVPDTEPRL